MRKLSIIVPCYNEGNTVIRTLSHLKNLRLPVPYEIIVVDDGSTDATGIQLAAHRKHHGISVLRHAKNMGKGASVRTGLTAASGDFVLIQDADAEYTPSDITHLVAFVVRTGSPVVYGSRNLMKTGRGSHLFFWGGVFISQCVNLLYKQNLTDVCTGYKMFKITLVDKPLVENRFGFCMELTLRFLDRGILIPEIPVRYDPRSFAEGKKIAVGDGLHMLALLVRHFITHRPTELAMRS